MQLIAESRSGLEGRRRFRQRLMEAPLLLLHGYVALVMLQDELSVSGVEVVMEVLDKRFASGCFLDMVVWLTDREGVPEEPDDFSVETAAREALGRWTMSYCQTIGHLLERLKNYRAALPWFEKAEERGQLALAGDERDRLVSAAQFDLGATHERFGNLSAALRYYEESMSFRSSFREKCCAHRDKLLQEMKFWTGTSGRMTPE